MRLKLTIAYFGKNYVGWQKQLNGLSVAKVLEDTFFAISGERVEFNGSGRTDSGVHALGQVAHIDTNCSIPLDKFPLAMNTYLPSDIRILKAEKVSADFHARFSAKKKTYTYKVYNSNIANPFFTDTHTLIKPKLDVLAMKKAAAFLIGEHDFRSFMASGSAVKDTVRTVYSLSVTKKGKEIIFRISGNGFLYNMVRIIVGTLVDIGLGHIPESSMPDILESGDRQKAGRTLPATGLFLLKVKYK